ncbi:helix-turn-helix domain-containing protein [Herbiconiux daphne]|uniref:Helix-turn-helix transcriptional regulator n=1 Tax=Herbiconiux daphne TaxID=2970914 RepID=A0ABT2H7N7_9MICO|nr:helix-turn-helix transcriptional regulator [Herbiconiux daphne]MCS5735950.1 helix-turn-helix transcriptional regulator [Herbiconiux daphne]
MTTTERDDRVTHEPLGALADAIVAGDLDLASRVACAGWARLLEGSARQTVALLETIPRPELRRHPLLAMVLGLAYDAVADDGVRAIELFTLAIAASRVRADATDPVERFVLTVGESAAYRLTGGYDRAGRSAERALRQFERLSPAGRDEVAPNAHHLLAQAGTSLLYAGHGDRALDALRAAFSASTRLADPRSRLRPLALIAATQALGGDMPAARVAIERLESLPAPDGWRAGRAGALYRVTRALDALERFDPDGAQAQLDMVALSTVPAEERGIVVGVRALVQLSAHRNRAGSIELRAELERPTGRRMPPSVRAWLVSLLALQLLGCARPAEAEAVLARHAEAAAPTTPHPKVPAPTILARALLALLADDGAEALRVLDTCDLADSRTRRIDVAFSLVRAAALLRLGEGRGAAAATAEAVEQMRAGGLSAGILVIPDADRAALAENAREHALEQTAGLLDSLAVHASFLPAAMAPVRLTERETTVLQQLSETGSTAEIARSLFVSPNTVKTQLRSLYRKLGAGSRHEALAAATARGLLGR